jgi:S1-C subfamily serine protease
VLVGAAAASPVADLLSIHGPLGKPVVGVICLIVGGSLGSSLGYWLGQLVHRGLIRSAGAWEVNRALGALISGAAVLAVSWFLGLSFATGPSAAVSQQVQRSAILRQIDHYFPQPPGFLATVEQVLSGLPFPRVFAGLEPTTTPLALPPDCVANAQSACVAAAKATVKVQSLGCGGLVTGSGFPVATDYLVTNAHVVSGTRAHAIITTDGRNLRATVVLFDPNRDVAILHVPGLGFSPLRTTTGARGTQGAVIGYPGGGDEKSGPAVVDDEVMAQGRDIYNQGFVTRQIYILQATVIPGNSGGPLIDVHGNVLGVVFAASSSDPNQAYALTEAEVAGDIRSGVGQTAAIDTSAYSCAV